MLIHHMINLNLDLDVFAVLEKYRLDMNVAWMVTLMEITVKKIA